jgi:hypothetical protein
MSNAMPLFLERAQEIDAGMKNLVAVLALRQDGKFACFNGEEKRTLKHVLDMKPLRTCFVSLNLAADLT